MFIHEAGNLPRPDVPTNILFINAADIMHSRERGLRRSRCRIIREYIDGVLLR